MEQELSAMINYFDNIPFSAFIPLTIELLTN